jgi:excisionase family DNA binding protein
MALRYLTTAEAAKAIGVSPNTIRTYIAAKALPAVNVARTGRKRIRISEDALKAFMDARPNDTGDGAA